MVGNRRLAKRAEILAAASRVFREEGYEAATMDRIADVAGASKRTVYNHFGSKDALFGAVLTPIMDAQLARKNVVFDPDVDISTQLRVFAETKASYAEDEEILGLLRVLLGVSISHPELLAEFVRRYIVEVDDSLIPFLVAADAADALRVPDAVMAAQVFWWLAGSALFWPATLGISLDPSARDTAIDEVLATFLARFGVE